MRFEPLIRCDIAGCVSLIEPHVLRCQEHRELVGVHPAATGRPGRRPPASHPSIRNTPARKRGHCQSAHINGSSASTMGPGGDQESA